MSMIRSRWAALGAAVAVTLGAGGLSLTHAAPVSTGSKPIFVAVDPCRLIDTRGNVGPRDTALGAGEVLTLQITGATGDCTGIPADAVAAALNITAIRGSAQSFLTVYPGDAASVPTASNLNWRAGDGPTANKVDVKLGAGGDVNVFNSIGTVHVAADLVGYYIDHTHDDRYYTESEIDGKLTAKADASDVYTKTEIDGMLTAKADASDIYTKTEVDSLLKPLYAIVLSGGSLYSVNNSGVVASTKLSTGTYLVTFERPVNTCVAVASDAIFTGTRDVSPDPTSDAANQVRVVVTNTSGAEEDTAFELLVVCPPTTGVGAAAASELAGADTEGLQR